MAHRWWHRGKTKLKTKKEQYELGQKSKSASVRKATKAGAEREGVIPKKTVKTKKGGDFPVYAKKSKTAKSFRSTFKAKCAGKGSGDSFSWQGRSYSCAKASDKKKVAKPKEVAPNVKKAGKVFGGKQRKFGQDMKPYGKK